MSFDWLDILLFYLGGNLLLYYTTMHVWWMMERRHIPKGFEGTRLRHPFLEPGWGKRIDWLHGILEFVGAAVLGWVVFILILLFRENDWYYEGKFDSPFDNPMSESDGI